MLLSRAGVGKWWSCIELEAHNGECNSKEMDNFLEVMEQQLIRNEIFQPDRCVSCDNNCTGNNSGSCHVIAHEHIRDRRTLSSRFQHFKNQKVNILFVILPKKDPATYALVKQVADLDVGIHTTCIVRYPNWQRGLKTNNGHEIRELKCDPDAALNILQKVNLRLGGTNLTLTPPTTPQLFHRDTIILGADVTHPGPTSQRECRSIAAVVGTTDRDFNHYSASLRCQAGKQETITHFANMVCARLAHWQSHNAPHHAATTRPQLPTRLVIFRDGVSESQFQTVLREEWAPLRAVLQARYAANGQQRPQVLLLCVLKRHGARFFPVHQRDQNRNGNPRCGLMVAEGVTYENAYDFYL
jgi:eukaryotic translation initiation factor 2C